MADRRNNSIVGATMNTQMVLPGWIADLLNRRSKVEATLRKGQPLTAEQMKQLAVLLSVPTEFAAPVSPANILGVASEIHDRIKDGFADERTIAMAIITERERCRLIADDYDQSPGNDSPMGPVMLGQVQVAQEISTRIVGGDGSAASAFTEISVANAVNAERRRCAAIARRKANHAFDDCERLGFEDPETGVRECSLEANGRDCLCELAKEIADEIGQEIEGGKANG